MAAISTKRLRHTPLALALAGACAAMPACAIDWKVRPRIEARQTWTDNVHLAPLGFEQSDSVTQLSPGFSLRVDGRRLKADADYTLDYFDYGKRAIPHRLLHNFIGKADAELVPDWLYLNANGLIGQMNADVFGPVAADGSLLYATGNLIETRAYRVAPALRHEFGNLVRAELSYSWEGFHATEDPLSNRKLERATLMLSSGTRFADLGWSLAHTDQTIDYENGAKVGVVSTNAGARYHIRRDLALTASAGHERYGYVALADRASGPSWSVGLAWRPSTRTQLEVSAGKRFFGNTYLLGFTHRYRRLGWSVSYKEDITTTQEQFRLGATNNTAAYLDNLWQALIPDPAARRDAIAAFIRDTGLPSALGNGLAAYSNRFFLQKNANAALTFNVRRHTLLLGAFDARNRAVSGLNVAPDLLGSAGAFVERANVRQTGAQAVARLGLSQRTALTGSASVTRVTDLDALRRDIVRTAGVDLSHRFSATLRADLEVRRMRQTSSAWDGNRRENAASISLTKHF